MLSCLIYFSLTTLIPLKLTYEALSENHKDTALWSHYWAFYAFLRLVTCFLPFLNKYPHPHLVSPSSSSSCCCTSGSTPSTTGAPFSSDSSSRAKSTSSNSLSISRWCKSWEK